MPVDEDINLDAPEGLTQSDIDELNRQANEVEQIAIKTERNVGIIKQNLEKLKGLEEGKDFVTRNAMQGNSEDIENLGFTAGGSVNERIALLEEAVENLIIASQTNKTGIKRNKKKLTEAEMERAEMMEEFQKNKSQINEVYGEISSFRGSPLNFGKGKIKNLLGRAGLYGMIATFAWEMGESLYKQIYSEIRSLFGKGGVYDTRKLVEDVVNEYHSINYLTKIKSGQVIFTADAGQDLAQGAVRGAYNTRDLRDGHLRFIQLRRGS